MRQFLTVPEVADRWKVNARKVYEYINADDLRAIRFGRSWRIELNDLERFEDKLRRECADELRRFRLGC